MIGALLESLVKNTVKAVQMGAEKIMVIATKKPLDGSLTEYSTISDPGFFIAAKAPNTKAITY